MNSVSSSVHDIPVTAKRSKNKAPNPLVSFIMELVNDLRNGLDLENAKSDSLVQHHFNGLFTVMLALVALFLLASIGAIALFLHY